MCPPRSGAGVGSAEPLFCVQPRPAVAPRRERLRAPHRASLHIPPGAADAPWGMEFCGQWGVLSCAIERFGKLPFSYTNVFTGVLTVFSW